jgi:glutamate transport system substrate-binding protein
VLGLTRWYAVVCTLICAVLCAAVAIASCGFNFGGVLGATVTAGPNLRVGIQVDQPGLGMRTADGSLRGFDIDVARYVAAELDAMSWVSFVEARPSEREAMLERAEVDFVVATYSITPERRQRVDFAGPYFAAGQSLLVRRHNADIHGPRSLDHPDWRLCAVHGTPDAARIRTDFAGQVSLSEFPGYPQCVQALLNGEVDAVTTDDAILAGYAAQRPDKLKVVGQPFSRELYGIGIRKGDQRRDKINQALRNMIDDGSWLRSAQEHLGGSGYQIPEPPMTED